MSHFDAIVVGAGVVGPPLATVLARQGRKVLIVERDWLKPDRIVGELMQPGGLRALASMGLASTVNNIEAIPVDGYYILLNGNAQQLLYPYKALVRLSLEPVPGCVFDGNDKIVTDLTIDTKAWDRDPRVHGVAFHHGGFVGNLRSTVRAEPNVTALEGTVTQLVYKDGEVVGVEVKLEGVPAPTTYTADLTFAVDGIYLRLRKQLSPEYAPQVGSHFVGMELHNAVLPAPNHGHVLLGAHLPILVYQISPSTTRILCCYRLSKPPSQRDNQLSDFLNGEVLPNLPAQMQPLFVEAVKLNQFRIMPNQWMPAKQNTVPGLVVVGDALNMRHPLTGGGMTVGLNDCALMGRLLCPEQVPRLLDRARVDAAMKQFHRERKQLDAVVNVLSIALYMLFDAESESLQILQRGCFAYFLRGGACVEDPIGFLSGVFPLPAMLFYHFFSVAFYAIGLNFGDKVRRHGVVGVLVALGQVFTVLYTAVVVFAPVLVKELTS